MSFTTAEFVVFVAVGFALHWLGARRGVGVQNSITSILGLLFYASFGWPFCALLVFEIVIAYASARLLEFCRRKLFLTAAIVLLLFPLGCFKYLDFCIETLNVFGAGFSIWNLILPVGISFYTFMAIGYVVDVFRKELPAERNLICFGAFMLFFPQLTAGPIGRARAMLPQFRTARRFSNQEAVAGCRRILWGSFKKMVVADLAAKAVGPVFAFPSDFGSAALWIGALLFTVQIYADFSGYTDMALGVARLFGIRLDENFRCPYFATDISDFWRRWHISLTSWFRDYLYIPLGGSRCSRPKTMRNVLVVFVVSGLWHGAAWNFVLWGAIHGLLFLPRFFLGKTKLPAFACWALTFLAVMLSWVFFRASDISHAFDYFAGLFSPSGTGIPGGMLNVLPWAAVMFALEWWKGDRSCPLDLAYPRRWIAWLVYFIIIVLVFAFHPSDARFIYAQF